MNEDRVVFVFIMALLLTTFGCGFAVGRWSTDNFKEPNLPLDLDDNICTINSRIWENKMDQCVSIVGMCMDRLRACEGVTR